VNLFSHRTLGGRVVDGRPIAREEEEPLILAVMARSPALRLLVCVLGLAFGTDGEAASPRERRFFSTRHGVGIEAPPGWTLSQHTGYPSILVVLLHPNGSRISISAATTTAKDARGLVEQNQKGLQAQKLTVTRQASGPRGGVLIDARATDRDEVVRQLYLVRVLGDDRQAVVITLVTRPSQLADASSGFDWALGHLALETPAGRTTEAPDGGRREESSAGERAADKERR
jgi:hypothetical protein